ncbi:MAG: DsbA family protein [Alphaproteobacteria bacterium]
MLKRLSRRRVAVVAAVVLVAVAGTLAFGLGRGLEPAPEAASDAAAETQIDAAVDRLLADVAAPEAAGVVHAGEGDLVVTVFSSPNCPHCRTFSATVRAAARARPEVTYQVREVAFNDADREAVAVTTALDAQNLYPDFYARFADVEGELDGRSARELARALGADMAMLEAAVANGASDAEVSHNRELAGAIGLRATPSVIVAGRLLEGAVDRATLLRLIDEARG